MTDNITTVSVTTGWFDLVRKYLPTIILIGGGVWFLTTFFNTGKADHQDIQNLKLQIQQLEKDKASNDALKALQDQVNRQYQVNADDKAKENKAIEEVADWMHEEIGYRNAINEKRGK